MDSTFLGVLSGFGLSMRQRPGPGDRRLEILNANARIIELLETMGVIHLFKLGEGQGVCAPEEPVPKGSPPVVLGTATPACSGSSRNLR